MRQIALGLLFDDHVNKLFQLLARRGGFTVGDLPNDPIQLAGQAAGDLYVKIEVLNRRNRVVALDIDHDGKVTGSISTGDGIDNLDYCESQRTLYAASSKAATLTVAHVDDRGQLKPIATVPSVEGARSIVVDRKGRAYVADPRHGRILVFTPL